MFVIQYVRLINLPVWWVKIGYLQLCRVPLRCHLGALRCLRMELELRARSGGLVGGRHRGQNPINLVQCPRH